MHNKSLKFIIVALIGFLSIWGFEEFFRRKIGGFAGSYPFAKTWTIHASEQEVVNAIKVLRETNPSFQPPQNITQFSHRDTTNELDYWLYIKLYYPDTQEIVHTWTRPQKDRYLTTLAFNSLSKYNHPTDSRLINRDFWYLANKREINRFESTFVAVIKEQIKENRKNGI